MQGLICPAQCKTEPLKALDSRQKEPQYLRLQYPRVQKKKKKKGGGGFGKSRMHRETEISKTEFLAAGETHKV